jgi:hypothetical protein
LQQAIQEPHGCVKRAVHPIFLILGDEYPGQRDVLELAQVTEVIVRG